MRSTKSMAMSDFPKEPIFQEKLNYIFKLWLTIAQKNNSVTMGEILLASKRLVEEYDGEDVKRSIREYETLKQSVSIQQAIEQVNALELAEKYKILIDLFMIVTLHSVNNQDIQALFQSHQFEMDAMTMLGLNDESMDFLKDIYRQCDALFLYEAMFKILDYNYTEAEQILRENQDVIEFIYLNNERISDSNTSTEMFDVKFSIMKIEQSFILINSESSDLSLYEYSNPSPNENMHESIQVLVRMFKEERELFDTKVVRNHSAYSLKNKTLLRIKNRDKELFIDESMLYCLFERHTEKRVESCLYEDNSFSLKTAADEEDFEVKCEDSGRIQKLGAEELFCGYTPHQAINKNINFEISKGELVAIMGPSGAGKSTLMKTLVGQANIVSGELKVNCHYKLSKKYYSKIGYVPQDDVLIKELSVYENMYYYYRLHFGSAQSDAVIEKIITDQLRNLGILEIKSRRVFEKGKFQISGGQRKRLNIALELIKDVDLILIDEPTSGLSSLDSEKIIQQLKTITDDGKIIITVIHQPSSSMYQNFDQVILFNEDGFNIYTDKAMEVLRIFKLIKEEQIYFFDDKLDYEDVKCPSCQKADPEILLEVQEYEKSKFWNLFAYLKFFIEKKQ